MEVHEAIVSRERSSHERQHVSTAAQSFLVSSKTAARFLGKELPSVKLIKMFMNEWVDERSTQILTFCLWPATRKIPSSFAPRLTSSRKMLWSISGTSEVSSPVTCWSRLTKALSDTPKTFPSSLRFLLKGFRLSKPMWCLSKIVANSNHRTGWSFLMSPSGMLLISLHTSSIVSHSDPSEDFSVSRIMLSKLIGASWVIRYGVLELALWKLIMSRGRGGELPGLGDEDADEFEEVSLSMKRLLWLRVVDVIWLPLRMLRGIISMNFN